ncbi:GlsB/YeaQ/YmgE family stress response membrane protein [Nocardioides donggukensis]|uniref:GlsB/YeaQ/YmgE family stress response membrane protein n=1 Tax=Nocardioides donggukensis TaxID=2774019 RepID=A0A927KBD6_9ACTN|nr:GlsB/YeaQ/YmgE family stress response membrane protein [Nocardioides donggukensis]MBD8871075.1 GlsB/YeaQ/YmgE family stress response membrane protein [Nocardioides donggukensis]
MIGFIVFGLVVGALARLVKPGRQNLTILWTLILGLVGSVIGGTIASALGVGEITELNFWGTVFAVIAAVLLIGVAESMAGRKKVS